MAWTQGLLLVVATFAAVAAIVLVGMYLGARAEKALEDIEE